jgi:hypothetical protein
MWEKSQIVGILLLTAYVVVVTHLFATWHP